MAAMQPSDTHANSNDRSVVVLKTSDVTIRGNEVLMPILIEMSQIKKPEREQFKKVEITKEMTERDVTGKLLETFPYLRNQRFYCAAAADGRTRLDFNGDRRIWNGRLIKRLLKGNSALYIFVDEQVPGCANMAPQSEASSRTAVATATQNRVDLDATLVSSSHSLPMGSSGHKETQPAQGPFCALSVRYSPNTLQDSSSPEQLTTKRPPEQMTTAENELSNQTFKKLRATKGVSNNTEKHVAGDLTAGTPFRALGTATVQGKVSEIPSRSYQTEGQLQNLLCRNADMKESTLVTGQFEPPSFVCHPNLAIQDAKNTTMAIPSHSNPTTMSGNVSVKYPAPQMNSSWTSENDNYVPLQQFISWNSPLSNRSNNSPNVNTQPIQPMETDAHGVNQDLNSSASGRRWASSDKIAVSPQGPILDDLLESSNLCWRENDSSDSEIDFSNLIALSEMDDSELTSLLSPSGVDSSLIAQASNNVRLHSHNTTQQSRHNTIQMPGPLDAMQTQVSHVMRGNNSDSGLGSQSSSSAPQSRHTSDMENSALEEYPAIIKIRPNAVGLSGAPSCEFLGLAELFPEVQSGYATVGNLEKEILWKKGDKHGNGNCIPPSPKPGKQIVKIYSVTGRKLVEAELWYMDPCHHTDDECLVRVGEKASQSYEELCRVMSNILIRCRPHASIKSGESQYSGNSESSLIVQVLRFLINEAAESGLQWDSLPLLEFVAMNHDHENAALFLEEGTERYARDITPEGRERIDLSELLAAINASHEEDEASDISDGRNDSDSSYDGDVESLLCDSEEPTSDSEDDHSDMLRKAFATGNEIQMGGNNAETDERVILNLQSGYLSGAQIGQKETQPTHSRLKDSTVSVKESVITERVSDQPFPTSSDSMLPFGKNGKFSRKAIDIKQREKDSKILQREYRISRIREHFNCEFPNLTSMKSVRQPIICFLLTAESINRCLSTMEDRWRIQLHLQRLSGRMTMSPLSMLFQAMHIKPEEALKSLSADADLSSPSDNTSTARCKPFDSPLPSNDSTPSDVVALTSIYRPSGKILLSFVLDRKGFFPPESLLEDEDCELLMECWKWRRSKNNFLAEKLIEIKGVWPYLSKVTLPSMVPDFIGRKGECEEIIQDVTSKSARTVTIWGPPGIGKTSLAIAVGHSLRSQGCPVCYTSLQRVYSKDDLISEFLRVLRQPNINGQPFHQSVSLDDKLRQMVSLIGNRSLFILDDADELFDRGSSKVKEEVALLFEELMQNQGVAFLLISRKPIEYLNNRFEGHRDFRIGPLDETSAQSLLYRLLPDTTAADCAQISRACGQVPLALQLMCSLIRESSTQPRQILDHVLKSSNEDMEKIMNNPEYVPSCQIPFESYIESSYKSLSNQEQEALICLSLLSASFSTEEAVAELDLKEGFKAKEILQSLRSKSLIDFSPKHQSFTMHKVIQTFARKKKEEVFETNPHSKVRLTFDSPTKLMREEHKSTKDCTFSLVIPQSEINDLPATPLSHQRAQEILEFHQRALELFAEKNASTADYYYSLGNTQNKMNDLSSALKSQQHALDIRLQLFGDKHASSADSYYSLGNTQFQLKDFTSALESHKRALRIRLDLFGEKYASTADSYYSLGNTQYQMNDFTSALESHERALDIRLNLFGREHAGTADSYFSLGITQYEMGDFPLSQQSHQHALNIRLNLFGEDHARTADSYRELGLTSAHLYAFNSIVQRRQSPLAIFLKLHSVLEKNKQAEFRSKRSE